MTKLALTTWLLGAGLSLSAWSVGACGSDGAGAAGTTGHASSGQGAGGGSGGATSQGGGGGLSAKDACTDYGHARCKRVAACSGGYRIPAKYGDQDTCEFRLEQQCEAALLSPDEGETPDDVEACAAALDTLDCVALFDNDPPAACLPKKGSRAEGEPCGTHWQCKTAWCEPDRFSTCGICTQVPLTGSQCADDGECGAGLVCFKHFCAPPGGDNATCDRKLHPCHAGFTCVGSTDTTPGTCQKAGMKGDDCDPTAQSAPGCNEPMGLYCHPQVKRCIRALLVDPGQPCGVVDDHVTACKDDGTCRIPDGMVVGVCEAAAGDTQPCNVMGGPNCQTPAKCQSSTGGPDGVCTFPDPSLCGP